MSDTAVPTLGLFEAYGVELEYMIVRRDTLDVAPKAEEIFRAVTGDVEGEFDAGPLWWSNELVAHVVELKTNGPVAALSGLHQRFAEDARRINALLAPLNARLMPTAMHPWMDPHRETRLWTSDCSEIYATFDRIFDCRGHGWSNLQSAHLNLPFRGDAEFGRLHAAIRLLLPIIPALAASSPLFEGKLADAADARMTFYRANAAKVPSVSGRIIPEPVFTEADYRRVILDRIYADLAPHDPEGVLRYEWANARGAIARFERNAIEIRVIDVQECPRADLAIVEAIVAALRALTDERWSALAAQQVWPIAPLERILNETILRADRAVINDAEYLRAFGFPSDAPATAGELWRHLVETLPLETTPRADLRRMLERGALARRIADAVGPTLTRARIAEVYGELCDCLAEDRFFVAH